MSRPWHERMNHGGPRPPWFTFTLAALAIGFYCFAGAAAPAWVFDRSAIADGEWWRLISGHLVHSDAQHLLWDVSALVVIGWMLERHRPAIFGSGFLAGLLAVDAWLWLGMPELERYCGLSGVLHAVLLLLLAALWRTTPKSLVITMGFLIVGKVVLESWTHQALLTDTAWPSVPSAHLAGLCAGLAVFLLDNAKERRLNPGLRRAHMGKAKPGVSRL